MMRGGAGQGLVVFWFGGPVVGGKLLKHPTIILLNLSSAFLHPTRLINDDTL
jgi:hypothetical protein